ncbi:hypothetical protein LMH87_004506 [Akanthomyces muscarius]|uniref:FAD-binding FR-type domain-containing protein n=1 Tax=Akanthomyces muscarius TaxID=2231603 RepID=A0A9W8UH35_AKAMU|nr:hypothetical protein LMH87_004506 [Akanthomyces muscarius]KAJ4145666.1 hypothetical protein LMH87_004506 [Akanthomyces muscarius]
MKGSATKLGHLDRTATEPREKTLLSVRVAGVENANKKIRLLKLELREGPSDFLAGQWLDTFVPGDPKPGGFTIASAPSAAAQASEPYVELAVQEAPENPAAAWLWKPKNQIMGRHLDVRFGGSFVCPPSEGLEGIRRIVLVAGGVGINPLMSILGYIADENGELSIEVSLLYSTKATEDGDLGKVLFWDRIVDLIRRDRVVGRAKLFLTGPLSHARDSASYKTSDANIGFGRITRDDILPEIRAGGGKDSTLTYICGPPAMTDYFVDMLTAPNMASEIDATRVKSEKWW